MRQLLCAAAMAMALTACTAIRAGENEPGADAPLKLEDTPKLTIRGQAELEKPADQVRLSIGVVTEDKEAGAALKDNNRLMEGVIKAIERVGLTEDEYETGRFRIRPEYDRRPRQPEPNWEPKIKGYEVTNTLVVKTKQLDLAGEIIAAANKAGANTAEISGFELSDQRRYRAEAIAEATRNALTDAATLAEAASLELVRVLAINLDNTPNRMPQRAMASRSAGMAEAGSRPPINPGDIKVTATVTIVYEIAPKE